MSSSGPQTVVVGEDRAAEPDRGDRADDLERIVVAGTDIARLGQGARTVHRRDQVGLHTRRLIAQLERLGHTVIIDPAA